MSKPWTREEVAKEPWFGGQKERVLATLDERDRHVELNTKLFAERAWLRENMSFILTFAYKIGHGPGFLGVTERDKPEFEALLERALKGETP